MRQLTASQKIAILENRVAQLEKQAFLDSIKESLASVFKPFSRLVSETKKIGRDTRMSPDQLAKEYMKVRRNPNLDKAMIHLRKEAGSNPVKQAIYTIETYKSGGFDNPAMARQASMNRQAGLFAIAGYALAKTASVACMMILGKILLSVGDFIFPKIFKRNKSASMEKQAGVLIFVLGLIFGFLAGVKLVNLLWKVENDPEFEDYR